MKSTFKAKKTNHVLHLILSIVTIGSWIIPWIIISICNMNSYTKTEESE